MQVPETAPPEAAGAQQANAESLARARARALAMLVEVACSSFVCRCTLHGFSVVAGLVMVEHKANKVYLLGGGGAGAGIVVVVPGVGLGSGMLSRVSAAKLAGSSVV